METWNQKRERLMLWITELSDKQRKELLLELVEELIEREEIHFWDDSEKPYWSTNGEYIDRT